MGIKLVTTLFTGFLVAIIGGLLIYYGLKYLKKMSRRNSTKRESNRRNSAETRTLNVTHVNFPIPNNSQRPTAESVNQQHIDLDAINGTAPPPPYEEIVSSEIK